MMRHLISIILIINIGLLFLNGYNLHNTSELLYELKVKNAEHMDAINKLCGDKI
jgi:hypothetical protein